LESRGVTVEHDCP